MPRNLVRTFVRVLTAILVMGSVHADAALRNRDSLVRVVGRPDEFGGYHTSHILVRYGPGEAAATRTSEIARLTARLGVRHCRPALSHPIKHVETAKELGLSRTLVVEVPEGQDPVAVANAYAALPDVEFAELDGIGGVAQFFPNDSLFSLQWSLHNSGPPNQVGLEDADIDAPEAWSIATDGEEVIIAIVDSGVDPHPELTGRLVPGINTNDPLNPNHTTTNLPPGENSGPRCVHGMHVAGIAAAAGNNLIGVAGVHWAAKIMPIRVVDGSCFGSELQTANGIIWAVDHGADVINVSLQFYGGSQTLRDAVEYAASAGVLVVAAAGNDQPDGVVAYPARFDAALAVSATNSFDLSAGFSNVGNEVDISAPGQDIYSTWTFYNPNPSYSYTPRSGTSMASPLVAGAAALVYSYRPTLTGDDLRFILESSSDDLGVPGWDPMFGMGRLNLHQALLAASDPTCPVSSNPPSGSIDARQPTELDGSRATGWRSLELTFSGAPLTVGPEDFEVEKIGGVNPPPTVIGVSTIADTTVSIVLQRTLEPVTRTIITHTDCSASVELGYLPGDVNGDGTTDVDDIVTLNFILGNNPDLMPIYRVDMNRSGKLTPLDLLRAADLLNGADAYPPYLGVSLP